LLQLGAELREWNDPQAKAWSAALKPLEDAAVERLTAWLPKLSRPDPGDPKLAHLDGLNLSRAWMLEGIVSGLPPGDPRAASLAAAAAQHREAGLRAVTGEHYEGGHWLGSFATYLTTRRGLAR
jgi:hypothetical protein